MILYFFIPKINIIDVGKFGIRPLDFVSLTILFLLIHKGYCYRFKVKAVFIVMMFFIVGFLVNVFHNGLIGVVYEIRLFQYMVVGIAIAIIVSSHYGKSFLYTVVAVQVLISILQMIQIVPHIDPIRGWYYSSIFSGSFGTPAEISYFFLSVVGLYMRTRFSARVFYAYILSFNHVFFAPLAFIALGLNRFISIFSQRFLFLSAYLLLFSIAIYVLGADLKVSFPDESSILTKGGNLPPDFLVPSGGESLVMRIDKFLSVYHYMQSNYAIMFFGCGYGCGDGAIDSGVVRLLLEFGVVGFLLALFLVKKIPIIPLVTIIFVNFLFDGLWSSVTAPIIFSYFFIITARNYNVCNK